MGLRAIFFILVAFVFFLLDYRVAAFHQFRNKLDMIVFPIQEVVNGPIKLVHSMAVSWTAQKNLLAENAQLRAHELLLQSQLQKLLMLQHENKQLRQLLSSTSHIAGKVKVAELLAVDLNPALQQIILNKGKHSGVYAGQPVLDGYGVMGQVIDVGLTTSKILLLTDTRSAIPVQDARNGVRAIAVGGGKSHDLSVTNIVNQEDIKPGDLFVTSGLGLRYPIGYPVGMVSHVQHVSGQRFAKIVLIPAAHMDQTQHVLLAWPDQAAYMPIVKKLLAKPLPDATVSSNGKQVG